MVEVSKFDAADYLKTPVAIAAYLTEAFETNDPAYICTALDTVRVPKALRISQRPQAFRGKACTKHSRKRAPEFDTVRKVMKYLASSS